MALPEGLTVKFEGLVCGPLFEYSRSVGLEADTGFVYVGREEFGQFRVEETLPTIDGPGYAGTQERASPVRAKGNGFGSTGRLEVSETINGKTYGVTFESVLVSERAVETAFAVEDESELVRVELTDIRYLWRTRGVVFAWINMPKQGKEPAAQQAAAQAQDGATQTNGAGDPPFIPGSMNGGSPWTLRQVIEQKILPNLPGRPAINIFPGDLKDAIPIGHLWDGVLAKDALADLLDEFQLVLALDPAGTVSFWHEGSGDLQEPGSAVIKFDGVGIDERVSHSRRLVGYSYVPGMVMVLGPPILETKRSDNLEPVGEVNGKIVPLADALKSIGLSEAAARRFVFLTHAQRSVFGGVTPDGVKEFERWAFKWFRLPGGPEKNGDKLPMLNRGSVDEIGVMLPPRVWSESFTVVNNAALILRKAEAAGAFAVGNKQSDKVLTALEKAGADALRVVVNQDFSLQSSGFEIDAQHGIVKFAAIQGKVAQNAPLLTAELRDLNPQVQIEFGYVMKPGYNDDIQAQHRYFSLWARGKGAVAQQGSKPGPVTITQTQDPNATVPLIVFRPDLLEVHTPDGGSNKAQLDAVAKRVATQILSRPQATVGAIVQLHRPIALLNTGKVRSVVWRTEGGVPRVVAHIGTYDPLGPPPLPATHARIRADQSGAGESVFLPRSMRP